MSREVIFSPEAETEILQIFDFIAFRSNADRAADYVGRLTARCRSLADFPQRGSRRDELRPGLRIFGFERRVTIAFHFDDGRVVIDRVLYGGRDPSRLLGDND